MKSTNLYEEAIRRRDEVWEKVKELEKAVKKYPPGRIHLVRGRSQTMYYLRTDPKDKSGVYLSRKQNSKIKTYLQKQYDETILKNLQFEYQILEKFTQKTNQIMKRVQEAYLSLPEDTKQLVSPVAVSFEELRKDWESQPYCGKEFFDNTTVWITEKGERVRSKSELAIANALFRHGIPYKYECPMTLANGYTIYPDFTILDYRTCEEIYWEHRGMMDDRDYAKHAVQRIRDYQKSGIFLGSRLLITEETGGLPLGTAEIEEVIQAYLL